MNPEKDREQRLVICRVVIEVAGRPKEHIENALRAAINKMKEDKNIKLRKGDLYKAKEVDIKTEQKGQIWSTFSELELIFNDVNSLIGFCFDYMPSSVEILEPEDLKVNQKDLTNLLNDLAAKLHDISMAIKNLKAENVVLNKNASGLLNNILKLSLRGKKKTLKEISADIGIPEQQLDPFLKAFLEKNIVKKEGEKYILK